MIRPPETSPSAPPLVRFERVYAGYGGKPLLRDLNFSLHPGGHTALIGPNGAGKSTLLKLIQGDIRPLPNLPPDNPGRILFAFDGQEDASVLNAREHVRSVSPAMQRNYVRQGWRISGEEVVLSGLDNAPMLYGELSSRWYERAARLAEEADAAPLMAMQIPAMSQGQLRLILILRALISRPALLLLDEPFDGLDGAAREVVSRAIALAMRSDADRGTASGGTAEAHANGMADAAAVRTSERPFTGTTVLVSAHRPQDMPPGITKVLLVRHGTIAISPRQDLDALFSGGDAAASDGPPAGPARARGVDPALQAWAGPAAASPFVRDILGLAPTASPTPSTSHPPPASSASAPLFELRDVDVYVDRKRVLHGINWTVRRGERWLLSGPNGAGKSTLLRLLYGEEFAAFGGTLRWCGKERPGLDELRQGVGLVSDRLQDGYDYDLSAEEVVVSGLRGHIGLYAPPEARELALARRWLADFGLAGMADTPFFSLSSGTMRRVLLARALAPAPPVLLLDEPCSGLDRAGQALLFRVLKRLVDGGTTLVYVSHRREEHRPLLSHELVLAGGRVQSAGPRTVS